MDSTYVRNHIRDEIDGARGYLSLFKETGDIQALKMSVDELGHASYFLHQATELPEDLRIAYDDIKRVLLNELKGQEEMDETKQQTGEQVQNRPMQPN